MRTDRHRLVGCVCLAQPGWSASFDERPGCGAVRDGSAAIGAGRRDTRDYRLPFRATLFDKSPETNWLIPWHQDTALPVACRVEAPGWGPWSVKGGVCYAHAPAWALEQIVALRVSLDASTRDNGPLRVIPGSHLFGVMSDQSIDEHVRTHEPVECCCGPGGVVAMRPLILHSSSKVLSRESRRVLHPEYAGKLEMGGGGITLRVV